MSAIGNSRVLLVAYSALAVPSFCGLQITAAWANPPAAKNSHYERPVLMHVLPALSASKKAGRIYYEATCPPGEDFPLAFPRVDVRQPSSDAADVDTLRGMFLNKDDVVVTEDSPGIVRVRIGKVPDAILRTRISKLRLDPGAQYNFRLAIAAIERTVEVQSAMDELHVALPDTYSHFATLQPAEGLPHLPSEISNVTMDEALDMVAKTWSGIVLYGACSPPATFEVSFTKGIYIPGSSD